MTWTAYIDGGARGNPGPSAAGVHILDDADHPVFSAGLFLGRRTNNEAEYAGLLTALDVLLVAGAKDVLIRSDSELLVRQMTGQYRVKAPHLKQLHEDASAALRQIGRCRFEHVRRELNKDADALANQAMDAVSDVVVADPHNFFAKLDRPKPSASRPAARPETKTVSAVRGIQVAVVKAPKTGGCPARTKAGETFVFTTTTPAGLCVEACAAVVDAVLSLQIALEENSAVIEPMTITCGRPDCGAVFQLKAI